MPERPTIRAELSLFLSDLSLSIPQLDALRAGMELYGATAFSVFETFSPNEVTLSRVIAELFDPAGSHGQGLLFLNELLMAVDLPRINARDPVRARREVVTRENRRIDIVVETRNYLIGIENKPWAAQQDRQLEHYLEELAADLGGRQPVLIFMSSQVERSAEGKVVRMPYYADDHQRSLYCLLSKVVEQIKAQRPRDFVQDFMRYIDNTFGEGDVEEAVDKPYVDAVDAEFDAPDKRKAVAAVLLAQNKLNRRIISEIGNFILAEVHAKVGSQFEPAFPEAIDARLWQRWTPWGIRHPSWPVNCIVAVESQRDYWDDIKFGVQAPDSARLGEGEQGLASPARSILMNLVSELPGGKRTPYWAWEKKLHDANWGPEFAARLVLQSPTSRVEDHPVVQELAGQFVDMTRAVHDALS